MDKITLLERLTIKPEKPTQQRRIFLSNIDLVLVAYQESVSFYDPPKITFDEAREKLIIALKRLFVYYDFFAGRLAPSSEDNQRLEIDCNGAGVVFVVAKTETTLAQLGDLVAPKPEFKQFIAFLHEENEDQLEIQDMPLLFVQLTQLGCRNIAFASRYNHCVLDGVAVREFQANMAALTRGENIIIPPNPDRTIFKSRDPLVINHPHHEYSKPTEKDHSLLFRTKITANFDHFSPYNRTHLIYLSPPHIAGIKKSALKDNKLSGCTIFQAVTAKIWKARTVAIDMKIDMISGIFFPVDARKRMVPAVPVGFAGNAVVPGYATVDVREMRERDDFSFLVKKVQEGLERLNDEYVRSSIDWLEVNKGVPWRENCFSLVAWWRLGLEEDEFVWGKVRSSAPVTLKPGLVYLLPGSEGGLNVCIDLDDDQIKEFRRLIMEI